jgi:hypothetical protein
MNGFFILFLSNENNNRKIQKNLISIKVAQGFFTLIISSNRQNIFPMKSDQTLRKHQN